jgi:hypothetical protein
VQAGQQSVLEPNSALASTVDGRKRKVQKTQPQRFLKRSKYSHARANILDFYTPVSTEGEKELFWNLLPNHVKGRTVNWKSMAAQWNRCLTDVIHNGSVSAIARNHVFFKHYTHLQKYGKKIRDKSVEWERAHRINALQALERGAIDGLGSVALPDLNANPP